jgi:hypothetical protein
VVRQSGPLNKGYYLQAREIGHVFGKTQPFPQIRACGKRASWLIAHINKCYPELLSACSAGQAGVVGKTEDGVQNSQGLLDLAARFRGFAQQTGQADYARQMLRAATELEKQAVSLRNRQPAEPEQRVA